MVDSIQHCLVQLAGIDLGSTAHLPLQTHQLHLPVQKGTCKLHVQVIIIKFLFHLCKVFHNHTANNTKHWMTAVNTITKKGMSAIEQAHHW